MRCKFLLILCLQMSAVLAAYNSSVLRNSSDSNGNGLRVQSSKIQFAVKNTRVKEENSLVPEENEESDLKSMICSTFPGTCSRLASFSKQLLRLGSAFEGRGPKDLIAIVSTMLATLLGAILVKLNVLIVLSLISVGIGKILVVLLTLKSHLFAHKTQSPIVYEKVFYPHHNKELVSQLPQSYQVQEDYPTYNFSR